jgi:hypothetical protein
VNLDTVLKHEFVQFIPDELEQGTVYVSTRFATASHLCLCGCGNKVVTPIRPTDWILIFDGKTISLQPSIGNWSFPCQSHYWITNNRIKWAAKWSKEQIERGRTDDTHMKQRYFSGRGGITDNNVAANMPAKAEKSLGSFWRKLKWW